MFTEYRDTLMALSAALSGETSICTLHGGASRGARVTGPRAVCRRPGADADCDRRRRRRAEPAARVPSGRACGAAVVARAPGTTQRPRRPSWAASTRARVASAGRSLARGADHRRVGGSSRPHAGGRCRCRDAGVPVAAHAVEPSALDPGVVRAGGEDDAEEVAEELERVRRLVSRLHERSWNSREVARCGPIFRGAASGAWPGGLPPGATIVCLLPASTRGSRPVLIPVHVVDGAPSAWPPIAVVAGTGTRGGQHRGVTRPARRAHRRASCTGARVAGTRAAGAGTCRRPLARLALRAPHRTHRRGGTRWRRGTDATAPAEVDRAWRRRRPGSRSGPGVAGGLTCQRRSPGHCCRPNISVRPATIARRCPCRRLARTARCARRSGSTLGPATHPAHVFASAVRPLVQWLGWPSPCPARVAAGDLAGLCPRSVARRSGRPRRRAAWPRQGRVARSDERRADARPPVAARHRRASRFVSLTACEARAAGSSTSISTSARAMRRRWRG